MEVLRSRPRRARRTGTPTSAPSSRCSRRRPTKHAPWYVVPVDKKWFARLAIAELVVEALESLDLAYPKPSKEHLRELAEARKRLSRNLDRARTVR